MELISLADDGIERLVVWYCVQVHSTGPRRVCGHWISEKTADPEELRPNTDTHRLFQTAVGNKFTEAF
jgi:hypothetical protein